MCPHHLLLLTFSFLPLLSSSSPLLPIGALASVDSPIGRVAILAMEMAVLHINRNGSLLHGNQLELHVLDTNCSAFQGAAAALELMKKDVVAVLGPQSTAVAHFVAYMGGATEVPIVSYAATDPTLSEFQYPYFFRIAHTDAAQMQAVAAFIHLYGWRQVAAIFTDDDFGTNAATALDDALAASGRARLVQKSALSPFAYAAAVGAILSDLAATQTRVVVVHTTQALALLLFSQAKYLGMMSAGYVWIVSDSALAMDRLADSDDQLLGVLGIRPYFSTDSPQYRAFFSEWNKSQDGPPHIYGLYAYDAVWMVAKALDRSISDGVSLTFGEPVVAQNSSAAGTDLASLRRLQGGQGLRERMLRTADFAGVSGPVRLSPKGDLRRTAFEIVNVVGRNEMNVVGYWSNGTGLSVTPPPSRYGDNDNGSLPKSVASFNSTATSDMAIVWPGNTTRIPRGWVLPKNGQQLRIAVPKKQGFKQFVSKSDNSSGFNGFCIDVFQNALKYIPYFIPYDFVFYGTDTTPVYDDMIDALANKEYDAVVGDVVITTKRMEIVDFSQPYAESGLVVVVPTRGSHSHNAWAFLRPFSATMWLTTLAFFVLTGLVIWMLEHKKNDDFRGRPKKQAITVLWFSFSTLFFSHSERIKSALGRFVLLIWLFVVLIITSSYTANLTSILTVQQLSPTIQGINSLQTTSDPIGYQTGSFARDYLISINIQKERLKPLPTMEAYANALRLGPYRGGVAAVVDELPYVQLFLGTHCGFTIAGQEFTKGGWGFAFPKDSELAVDMSTAILTMSENGELQRIHDLWLSIGQCNSDDNELESNQLNLNSFWGLFLISGLASFMSLAIYMLRLLLRFHRDGSRSRQAALQSSWSSRSLHFIRSFASFVDEPGTQQKNKRKQIMGHHQPSADADADACQETSDGSGHSAASQKITSSQIASAMEDRSNSGCLHCCTCNNRIDPFKGRSECA